MNDALATAERYLELGRTEQAARDIAAHLASRPDDVRGLCVAALIGIHQQDGEVAERYARRAVTLAPDDEWAMRLLSIAHGLRGNHAAALVAADRAIELAPGGWQTYANRAGVATRAHKVDRKALDAAHRAVTIAPDLPDTNNVLGWANLSAHRLGAAQASFERSLRVDPANDEARRGLATIAVRRFAPWRAWRPAREQLGRTASGGHAAALLRVAAHRAVWVFGVVVMICGQVGRTSFEQRFDGVPLPATTAPLSVVLLTIVLCFGAGWALLVVLGSGGGLAAVRGAVHVHPTLRIWVALLVVAVGLMGWAVVLPPASADGVYGCADALAIGGGVISVIGLRRARRGGRRRGRRS